MLPYCESCLELFCIEGTTAIVVYQEEPLLNHVQYRLRQWGLRQAELVLLSPVACLVVCVFGFVGILQTARSGLPDTPGSSAQLAREHEQRASTFLSSAIWRSLCSSVRSSLAILCRAILTGVSCLWTGCAVIDLPSPEVAESRVCPELIAELRMRRPFSLPTALRIQRYQPSA